jgi:hypothetical protein
VARSAQLRQTSLDEETNPTVANHIENSNIEEYNVAEDDGVSPPSTPPSTTMHGIGSSKKISVIKGCKKEDMLKEIEHVEFNGYYVRVVAKNI